MILAAFSSRCCYEFWLPFPPAAAEAFAAAAAGPRTGKHHGVKDGDAPKSETLLLLVPGWENTMAVKDGEAPKLHPENA